MPEKMSELSNHLRRRVAIDRVSPEIDAGRFAVKRVRGDVVTVEADILCDGHEELECRLHVRHGDTGQWTVLPLECQGNDRWTASFIADRIGLWHYFISARIDAFGTWLRDLGRREAAGENLTVELVAGAQIVTASAHTAPAAEAREIDGLAMSSRNSRLTAAQRRLAPQLAQVLREAPDAATARATLEAAGFRIDYLEDRALGTSHAAASRRYTAAFLGETRLIDNVALD